MNESVLIILQIEHVGALGHIDEILAVPGISSLVIGSNDLAASMGLPGESRRPEVLAAIDRVIAAAHKKGVPIGIGVGNDFKIITEWIMKGLQWVALSSDVGLMISALDQVHAQVREFLSQRDRASVRAERSGQ